MIDTNESLVRYSATGAADKIGNRYQMVLIAARRAQELGRGYKRLVITDAGNKVCALQEIEAGLVGKEQLLKPPFLAPREKKYDKR